METVYSLSSAPFERDCVELHVPSQTASHKQTWTTRAVKRIWKEERRRRKADLKFLSRPSLTFSRYGRERERERARAQAEGVLSPQSKDGIGQKMCFPPLFSLGVLYFRIL